MNYLTFYKTYFSTTFDEFLEKESIGYVYEEDEDENSKAYILSPEKTQELAQLIGYVGLDTAYKNRKVYLKPQPPSEQ